MLLPGVDTRNIYGASFSCTVCSDTSSPSFENCRVSCDIFSDKFIARNDLGSLTL